jgi:ABC-type uncharacterized transport system substrate-binding protein
MNVNGPTAGWSGPAAAPAAQPVRYAAHALRTEDEAEPMTSTYRATMIIRAVVAATLVFAAVANAPRATDAQQAGKIIRVGILDIGTPQLFAAFRDGMRELGYLDGQNIVFEVRSAEGKPELIRQLAAELVRLNPDVIVTAHGPPSQALTQATQSIPIVVAAVADVAAAGLVTNLHRPGGNVTGLSFLNTELTSKRIELLKEVLPHIRRVAMLNDVHSVQNIVVETEKAAQRLGVELQRLDVHTAADFTERFEAAKRGQAQAIDVLPSAFFNSHRARIVELAAKHRIPAIYAHRDYVEAGGFMAYGPNLLDLARRAATYVDKILKGVKPGDLPIEQPTKFELLINVKTAKALRLTIPQPLLLRADQVLE